MRRSSPVCCDASFVVRLVTLTGENPFREQWDAWRAARRTVIAPYLLRYEATNAIHRYRRAGQLTSESADETIRAIVLLPIELRTDATLHTRATELADRFNRPAAYDAHYLALSEMMSAEFWTADQRLYNAVRHHLDWIHLVGA